MQNRYISRRNQEIMDDRRRPDVISAVVMGWMMDRRRCKRDEIESIDHTFFVLMGHWHDPIVLIPILSFHLCYCCISCVVIVMVL